MFCATSAVVIFLSDLRFLFSSFSVPLLQAASWAGRFDRQLPAFELSLSEADGAVEGN
jgi:hypothetical protein